MPRRSARQVVVPATAQESEPPSVPLTEGPEGNLFHLRRNWKWAAFTQFFYIFFDLFAISDISVADIENDLVHGTDIFIPRIMQRLLYTLTYDRKISLDNWQNALRKQYAKRDPDANPLGHPLSLTTSNSRLSSVPHEEEPINAPSGSTETDENPDKESLNDPASEAPSTRLNTEEPPIENGIKDEEDDRPTAHTIDWADLDMTQKLDAIHTLVEWQFQNPLRLRQIMKSDDEMATWRSEPVGYDRLQNAYWLIGGNRLWIQRTPPKPATKKRKRKDPPPKKGKITAKQKPSKRRKTQASKDDGPSKSAPPATPNGRNRAAKEQAKAKLDAQAKALAEFQQQQAAQTSSSRSVRSTRGSKPAPAPEPPRAAGTRTSSRLRNLQDDGWQQVPKEWLESDAKKSSKPTKTGLESDYDDSASDLTELSEEEDEEDEPQEDKAKSPTPEPELQGDFIEWETLCITLAEWEAFPQQFAQATHYTERSFYKYLTTVLVPEVTADLKAIEQKRRLEEALNHRKRSSRLAHKENEKEAIRMAAQRKADEEAQNARARRHEARMQREAEERERREKAREERRAAREARVAQRGVSLSKSEKEEDLSSADEAPAELPKPAPAAQANGKGKGKATSNRSKSRANTGKRTPVNDDWELDCEVCGRHGKNLDDGVPMMSCGSCSKWQHITCHDKLDASQGRPKRDWDKIDFLCRRCLSRRYASTVPAQVPPQQAATAAYSYPTHGYQNGSYSNHHTHPSHVDAYRTMGQTSSLRSSAYPPQSSYANSQPSTISFSHYQPQERAFTDPNRGQQQQPYNPYLRTTNGSWAADAMKYPSYGTQPQSTWNQTYAHPAHSASVSGHPIPSGQSSTLSSHHYDTSYQRGSYDPGPPPGRETYSQQYAAYPPPQAPVPMQQPYTHTRTPYPPPS